MCVMYEIDKWSDTGNLSNLIIIKLFVMAYRLFLISLGTMPKLGNGGTLGFAPFRPIYFQLLRACKCA